MDSTVWKSGIAFALLVFSFLGSPQSTRAASFLYSNGFFTTLKVPGAAEGINNSGQIVGNDGQASFLDTNGSVTTIVNPNFQGDTLAFAINNPGQIVGLVENGPVVHGFLDTAGAFTTIDHPGPVATLPFAVNNHAQIVGTLVFTGSTGMPDEDFLYTNGLFSQLAIPGDPLLNGNKPLGINEAGQIVGTFSVTGTSIEHGFLDTGGVFTTIEVPGAIETVVGGINDAGQIVGYYTNGFGSLEHGFLYADGIFATIDFPGPSGNTELFDINDAGQIVGTFTHPVPPPAPIPEPASPFLIVSPLLLMFWLSRRVRHMKSGT